MKIPPIIRANALRAYENTRAIQKSGGLPTPKPDQVEISAGAASFYSAFRSTMSGIENGVGESKLGEVSSKVEAGSYRISTSELAEKLLSGTHLNIKG